MFLDKEKLNNFLLELGFVSQNDFEDAQKEASEKNLDLNVVLIRKGYLDEDELREIQSKVADVSFVDLKDKDISDDILFSLPEPIVRKYNIIAFDRDSENLKIATLDLGILDEIDFLKKNVSLKIVPYLSDRESIKKNILKYQEALRDSYGEFIQKEFLSFQVLGENFTEEMSRQALLELARDKKLNNLFESFLEHALLQRATNIHIEPQENKTLIKYRIGGDIYPAMFLPKNASILLDLKVQVFTGLGKEEKSNKIFSVFLDEQECLFQVNKIDSLWGKRIVLNLLQQGNSGFSLEALGFHGQALDILYKGLNKKEKDILIVGEKGSGRTTSFYSFLDVLNSNYLSIGTVEESIAFQMNGLNQAVTNEKIGFGIREAINKFSKQNLDILGIDEITNLKDLELVLNKSWIERLNINVLESNEENAFGVIKELQKTKITNNSIASNIGIIICQSLVAGLDSSTKEEYFLSVEEIRKLKKKIDLDKVMNTLVEEGVVAKNKAWTEMLFYKGKAGKNKVMISEVFKITPVIKEMLLHKNPKKDLQEEFLNEGFLTKKEDLLFRCAQGLVSVDEVLKLL